jgi:hypothetical protein
LRLGEAYLAVGDHDAARTRLHVALRQFRTGEMWKEMLSCLEGFAALAQLAGQPPAAVHIAAAATVMRQRLGLVRYAAAESRWQARLESLRQQLDDERFAAAWNEACGWELDDAIEKALALPELAALPAMP